MRYISFVIWLVSPSLMTPATTLSYERKVLRFVSIWGDFLFKSKLWDSSSFWSPLMLLASNWSVLFERTLDTVDRAVLNSSISFICFNISWVTCFYVLINSVFSFTSLAIWSKMTPSEVYRLWVSLCKAWLNWFRSRGLLNSMWALLHSPMRYLSLLRVSSHCFIYGV